MTSENVPWFRRTNDPLPFQLSNRISSLSPDAPDYRTVACFPWSKSSLDILWDGAGCSPAERRGWDAMVKKYKDAVAIGADYRAYIVFTNKSNPPILINVPKEPPEVIMTQDKIHVAWAIAYTPKSWHPLVIIARGSLVYIYNPHLHGMAGYLRGHGNTITSIAVHPNRPHLFCTTSRDNTTRLYDLTLSPMERPNNPPWPPSTNPSLAGAAHGLHMNEYEGVGIGRCIVVLMGGRSGGHNAAVMGAAFHETLPIIATCGMDRCVKIWAVRPSENNEVLAREDKPLFSSSRIHKAMVLSVSWLQSDILLTHSAPAEMRVNPADRNNKKTYLEPGEVVVWRWLGLNRFFPPEMQNVRQTVLRGCASDFQESSSFKFITTYSLSSAQSRYDTHHLHFSQPPRHDPFALTTLPNSSSLSITNIALLKPRKMPTFSEMLPELELRHKLTTYDPDILMTMMEELEIETTSERDAKDDKGPGRRMEAAVRPAFRPQPLPGWDLQLTEEAMDNGSRLLCTALCPDGRSVVGVGTRASIWVWKRRD